MDLHSSCVLRTREDLPLLTLAAKQKTMRYLLSLQAMTITKCLALVVLFSCVSISSALANPKMSAAASETSIAAKRTIFDVPVSNNGARCRVILYKKEIPESEVCITSPAKLGGLKSEEYLAINPQGKMPAMICSETGMNLAEADTISRYLLSKYKDQGPSFQIDNPKSNLMCRIHDMYLTTIQNCMYKPPPFGVFRTRQDALAEYQKQLKVINDLIDPSEGMYLCGDEISLADATVFPSVVFAIYCLPKFDISPPLPPKLETWFNTMREKDSTLKKVYDEVMGGLLQWEEKGRWDTFLGAGLRDEEPATIFDKIIAGDIPAAIVRDDDKILAFKSIDPAAPAHVLIIPKHRNGLTRLSKASQEHVEILGLLMVAAGEISRDESLGFGDGARIVINDGPDGGQEVMHLHVHVLGGRAMKWPPG
jgi:diadenosine tetraphosphate (Ap4A) HIT family hydrolase/glutathione S-transferase